ncbi:MAG: thioredoxin domain-containing protein [Gemmatimonadetes bacterium]|nr:thioredoxin domain-containing protein [Gemmatimonadota bacterium]MYB07521.1 thioredoxin domain-containing protein [Gemmatimonadota bacterium]MYE14871.1 thioredoxin domain-containing protein [Gemmatimonadota bacterium]MYG21777.1 thioredoxin domain-containing protein [Gemmatimonadota bacterium]MYJ40416.1 thioredoxin domain-containing protein [Gemmatimonadota bacterium]
MFRTRKTKDILTMSSPTKRVSQRRRDLTAAQSSRQLLLDLTTVAVALAALAVAVLRVMDYVRPATLNTLEVSDTSRVSDYSDFAVGQRIGAPGVPVTIVEFSDFRCPFCARAATFLRQVLDEFPAEVSLVYRHYPILQGSDTAAAASECAGKQGRFESMHDVLFKNPESIGSKTWTQFAIDAHVPDTMAFEECLKSDDSRLILARDSVAAQVLGVSGTPTFLINDLKVVGFHGSEIMTDLITRALHDAR